MIVLSVMFGILAVVVSRWRRGISSDQTGIHTGLKWLAQVTALGFAAAVTSCAVRALVAFTPPPIYPFISPSERLSWRVAVFLVLAVAAGTCAVAALQPGLEPAKVDGRRSWALRRPAKIPVRLLAAIAALLLTGIGCFVLYSRHASTPTLGRDALLVTGLVALLTLVFGALPAVLMGLIPQPQGDGSRGRVGWSVGVLLLLVALAAVAQAIYDAYQLLSTWRMAGGLWRQLTSDQISQIIRSELIYLLPELSRYTVTPAVMLILLIAILALLWRLQDDTTEAASAPSATEPGALRQALLALLFAGFVVGWLDDFVVLSIPLAFVLALLLLRGMFPGPQRQAEPTKPAGSASATSDSEATDASKVDLTKGPRPSSWENALLAVSRGWSLAIPFIIFDVVVTLRAAFQVAQPRSISVAGLMQLLVDDLAFWFVAAFTLGYGYIWLRGRNGVVKGLLLAAVAMAAEALTALIQLQLGQQTGSPWEAISLRGWSLLLFLGALGARIDVETLRQHSFDWHQLEMAYRVERMRFLVAYVAPLLAAVIGIIVQLRSGQPQEAAQQALENATRLDPRSGGG